MDALVNNGFLYKESVMRKVLPWHDFVMVHLIFQHPVWSNDIVKYPISHVSIHGTQWVIQQIDVVVLVTSSRETYSLILTTAQIDTL